MKRLILSILITICVSIGYTQENIVSFNTFNLGVSYLKNGDVDSALLCFNKAVELNPQLSKSFYNLAYCYYEKAQFDSCLKYIDIYMQHRTNDRCYYLKGRCYHHLKNDSAAYSNYKLAVNANINLHESFFYMGILDYNNHHFNEAISNFNSAINLFNDDLYFFNRGCAYKQINKYDQAINDFNKALSLGFDNKEIRNALSYCHLMNGDYRFAFDQNRRSLIFDSTYVNAINTRGLIYYKMNNMKRAVSSFSDGLNFDPNNTILLNNRGLAYFEMGNYESALSDYNSLISTDDCDGESYFNRGNIKTMLRDKEGACEDWNKAIDLGITASKRILEGCRK